ncbi:eCIS core domain-containing protein [Shimia sp. MMG029]|uniref:eCIS core domain-containing protein n=1 Tax=Shimia sp. MMG029 TaxID=3021978 RepID=UPI0022FE29A5|nr:DUF4157 domain-containing protein [Shimia sp. MMG029]MDA5558512.1 DUF4157 domain-containing protein [Shimia sp. MMG029]
MALKRKVKRRARRKAPSVRKIGAGPIMVGGAQSAAETDAQMMVAGAATHRPKGVISPAPMLQRKADVVTPRTAPGSTPAPAPQIAEGAIRKFGAGRALSKAERARFEPQFNADLSAVRVHEGVQADKAMRALDARAFALGSDIALSSGAATPATLAHEIAHVVAAGDPYLRRELIRQPPGREEEPDPLTPAETAAAVTYNQQRFDQTSTEALLDIIGGAGRTEFAPEHVPEIQNWQADFRLPTDGKVGLRTVEPIGKEMIAAGMRNPVIQFIIDAHNFDTSNVASITYDRTLAPANASTSPNWGGASDIRVSPIGFRQGWRGLVHTIRHEIVHADQVAGMAAPANIEDVRPIMEFQAETTEILSQGMLLEGMGGLFNDATRAFNFWGLMSIAEKRAEWPNFQRVRDELKRRFDASSAATQARHQAVMDNFTSEAAP